MTAASCSLVLPEPEEKKRDTLALIQLATPVPALALEERLSAVGGMVVSADGLLACAREGQESSIYIVAIAEAEAFAAVPETEHRITRRIPLRAVAGYEPSLRKMATTFNWQLRQWDGCIDCLAPVSSYGKVAAHFLEEDIYHLVYGNRVADIWIPPRKLRGLLQHPDVQEVYVGYIPHAIYGQSADKMFQKAARLFNENF